MEQQIRTGETAAEQKRLQLLLRKVCGVGVELT